MAVCRPWNLTTFILECNHAHLGRMDLSFVFLCLLQVFFFFLNRSSIEPIIVESEPVPHSVAVKIKQGKIWGKIV